MPDGGVLPSIVPTPARPSVPAPTPPQPAASPQSVLPQPSAAAPTPDQPSGGHAVSPYGPGAPAYSQPTVAQAGAAGAAPTSAAADRPYADAPPAQQSYTQQPYAQQPYAQQPYTQQPYAAPYGQPMPVYDPAAKSRLAAGLFGIFLGGLGIHRFYVGDTGVGVAMLLISVLGALPTFGLAPAAVGIWGLIEGILYLTDKTGRYSVDSTGRPLAS